MKKFFLFITIFALLFCGCSNHAVFGENVTSQNINTSDSSDKQTDSFEMQMIDVGQGLCILIESDGHYMIYDGGGRDYSSYVVSYLSKTLGISHIDLMIASHYDEDHIAGLIGVMNTLPVDHVICPDYQSDSQIYQSFTDAIQTFQIEQIHPKNQDVFQLGNARIQIVNDGTMNTESDNDHSIACRITYGDTSILLTGDCEEASEMQMIASNQPLQSDIYVAGHHGSATSSCKELLETVSPKQVLISCGTGNPYGHPAKAMLERLAAESIELYRTDIQGTIHIYSDGNSYWFSQEPCDDWTPGTYTEQTKIAPAKPDAYKYILNTNSKLIHRPDCDSVKKMSDKNKEYTNQNLESLIASGYRQCHNCNPE